jgi:autoinducer 2-degrading protein
MYIVMVRMEVRPDKVGHLLELATFNSANSRKEPGNVRFDVLRSVENPNRFALYEVYKDEAAFKAHQETAHYARWRAEIGDLLVAPRTSEKYENVVPNPWA